MFYLLQTPVSKCLQVKEIKYMKYINKDKTSEKIKKVICTNSKDNIQAKPTVNVNKTFVYREKTQQRIFTLWFGESSTVEIIRIWHPVEKNLHYFLKNPKVFLQTNSQRWIKAVLSVWGDCTTCCVWNIRRRNRILLQNFNLSAAPQTSDDPRPRWDSRFKPTPVRSDGAVWGWSCWCCRGHCPKNNPPCSPPSSLLPPPDGSWFSGYLVGRGPTVQTLPILYPPSSSWPLVELRRDWMSLN